MIVTGDWGRAGHITQDALQHGAELLGHHEGRQGLCRQVAHRHRPRERKLPYHRRKNAGRQLVPLRARQNQNISSQACVLLQ